jgi:photosystem II stability/assembly factor-like uncharacterized protein
MLNTCRNVLVCLLLCASSSNAQIKNFWQDRSGTYASATQTMAIDSSGLIYVGSDSNGVLRSSDQGLTWKYVNTGLAERDIRSLAVFGSHVYAGTTKRLYRSNDRGETWERSSLAIVRGYTALAAKDTAAFAVADSLLVYKYIRADDRWENIYTSDAPITQIHAPSAERVYIGTLGAGLLRVTFTDSTTWDTIRIGNDSVLALASRDSIVYAGLSNTGVYVSMDTGRTFQHAPSKWGLNLGRIHALLVNKLGWVIAATDEGLSVSKSSRLDWSDHLNEPYDVRFRVLAMEPASGNVFAGSTMSRLGYTFWRSMDHGDTWDATQTGLRWRRVYSLYRLPNGTLLTGSSRGLLRSTDNGVNWLRTTLTDAGVLTMSVDPDEPTTIYAGSFGNGGQLFYRSSDNGVTWNIDTQGIGSRNFLNFGFGEDDKMYLGGGDSLFASSDGVSWSYLRRMGWEYFPSVATPAFEYNGFRHAEWRNDTSWMRAQGSKVIAYHTDHPDTLFAAADTVVMMSTDRGESWSVRYDKFWPVVKNGLVITRYGDFFAIASFHIWHSSDWGQSWTKINHDLPSGLKHKVYNLVVDEDRYVYALVDGMGIYRSLEPLGPRSSVVSSQRTTSLKLQVFPNPVVQTLNLTLPDGPHAHLSVTIRDATGRIQLHKPITHSSHQLTVDCTTLSDGLYYAHVRTTAGTYSAKFVVQ